LRRHCVLCVNGFSLLHPLPEFQNNVDQHQEHSSLNNFSQRSRGRYKKHTLRSEVVVAKMENLLPSHLARCLQGRRDIDLTDNGPNNLTTNASQAENNIRARPMQNTGRRTSDQRGTRPTMTATPPSLLVDQRPAYNTHFSSLHNLERSQNVLRNTVPRRQSVMATNAGHSLAAPNIVVDNYDQQQPASSGPSRLWPGEEHLNPSTPATTNQFVPGVDSRSNSTRGRDASNASRPQSYIVVEWNSPIIARKDNACYHSYIYRDAISDVLADPAGRKLIHPWPDFHPTTTGAGYDPKGGEFIRLTVKNRVSIWNGEGRQVTLRFTIVDRERVQNGRDGTEIDIVLGQDYAEQLTATQSTSMGLREGTQGPQFLNPSYQNWQIPHQSQNSLFSSENPVFDSNYQHTADLGPMGWQPGSNQMQSLPPYYPVGSSWTTMSSGQEGSGIIVSATSPDAPLGPTQF
ncbi:hypothetical protein F5Y01DRAFT_329741, partial [Xylaria sp. FL0043]